MRRLDLWRGAGFFIPTAGLVGYLHLRDGISAALAAEGILASLWFTAVASAAIAHQQRSFARDPHHHTSTSTPAPAEKLDQRPAPLASVVPHPLPNQR